MNKQIELIKRQIDLAIAELNFAKSQLDSPLWAPVQTKEAFSSLDSGNEYLKNAMANLRKIISG